MKSVGIIKHSILQQQEREERGKRKTRIAIGVLIEIITEEYQMGGPPLGLMIITLL